jgi:hypothetical protein
MLVYRVAAQSSSYGEALPRGPYTSYGLPEDIRSRIESMRWAHSDDEHPGPGKDPALGVIWTDERCGFESIDHLYQWFRGYIDLLIEGGFRLYTYEVPDNYDYYRVGKFGQTLFKEWAASEIAVSELDRYYVPGKAA